ncbi:Cytochrome P450 3A13 [Madurella mycetomatis]|uniref:Cytochrome P450 3A13 n=1 Tax=Madurella mycetomatis TaxID=100816 RepID=A0A175W3C8_9PEZI|nr:Cytochrome P450 3A13 [Madurella mycetomatis]
MLQYLLGTALAYVVWTFICLELNVRKARAMKVPCVRIVIDSNNIPWTIFQPFVWNILDRLPIKWSSYPDFVRYSRRGWHFDDKAQTHLRLGPVWALVTPVAIYLHFSDPDAIHEIFSRRRDFIRPYKELELLEVYGPCISTAGWDDWPRHRKVLAAPFNESIMKFAWSESIGQARAMIRYWTGVSGAGIPSVQRDTRTLSLNVLAATAFRKSYGFRGSSEPSIDDTGSYRDALQTVLDGVIPLMMIPYSILASSWFPLPKNLAKIGNAAVAFKKHMVSMLEDEVAALGQGKPGSGGIMTAFVRALDVHNREAAASPPVAKGDRKGLSVDEIFGNLFVLNFAGHDTTANTLAFATLLLAAHPEVQDWVSEEIRLVTKDIPTEEEWDYKTLFPQLKRCHAIFLETLRLYPPVMVIPKWVAGKTQTLEIENQIITMAPTTGIAVYVMAVHTHPDYWPDPLTWKPSRWILNPAESSPASASQLANEELYVPDRNTFLAWSEGPQSCPGRKFSEVEATVVMACLFKSHRLAVKKEDGESEEAARKRALDCVNHVNMEMLLRMVDADRVKLVCTEVA